jgi:CRISPR-associated protein Csm2
MSFIKPNFNPVSEFRKEWISTGIDEAGIQYLENFGYFLCDKKSETDRFAGRDAVTISQIRNIFGEVKRIESVIDAPKSEWKRDFLFLRPKIAYAAARVLSKSPYSKIKQFREVLEKAHAEVKEEAMRMKNFVKFFEAIVAYHKVYGGKD